MLFYIKNTEIDKTKWDNCIDNSLNRLTYAYSWYLTILCGNQWDAIIEDNYKSVCPLPFRKKSGINYIYTPFFVQQLGIFSSEIISEEKTNLFINSIPSKFRLVELNFNSGNKICLKKHSAEKKRNLTLDLNKPYSEIQKNYSENLKRNLKKALKNNFQFNNNEDPDSIIELFRASKGKEIKHWKKREYKLLKNLIDKCIENNIAEIIGVRSDKNELYAGAIILNKNNRSIFIFSSLSQQGKNTNAMCYLIDNYIKKHCNKHHIFDFEGSNDENLARFYKSFGSKDTSYMHLKRNSLPFPINFFKLFLKSLKNKLP